MSKIIIVNSFKGGVLKTTIASNLASLLTLKDKKVLLVDLDAQGDLRVSFNILEKEDEKNLYDLLVNNVEISKCTYEYNENLHLLLSDARMENYEYDILTNFYKKDNFIENLQEKLEDVYDLYDYIVVDTSPSFSILTLQAYNLDSKKGLKTDIVIPFQPEIFGLKNLVRQINKIYKFKNDFNEQLDIKMIIATKTMNNNTHRMILNQTKQFLQASNIKMSNTEIKNTIKFTEYLITKEKPLALEKDEDLNKEYKVFKQVYKDILSELDYK